MPEEKKEDLKQEDKTSKDAGQPEKKEPTPQELEAERLKKLEDELAKEKELREKAELERDNYKTGLISAKSKKMTLTDDEPEEIKEVKPPEEDESWKEVERRADKIAETKFQERSKKEAKDNERIAIKKFLGAHLEIDEALWGGIKDEYVNQHGKSVEGITLDIERAYKLYKIDNNIPFEAPKKDIKVDDLANQPGAGKSTPSTGEFNEKELKFMKEQNLTPENFKTFKQRVMEGNLSIPREEMRDLEWI